MTEIIKPNKPTAGTWAKMSSMPTEQQERHPKIEFEINIPKIVIFTSNEPREYPSKSDPDQVFYVFDCEENAQPKVIIASAWSLLNGLKQITPLIGNKVEITKKLIKGTTKQTYEVKVLK
jgi:hypothetical protein